MRRDGDLGVIAGGFKRLVALEQRGVELVGALDAGAQYRRAEAMEVAAGGVDNQQALRGKDLRVEIGEGLSEGAAGLVGSDQCVHCVGGAEQLRMPVDERRDGFVEHDAADGHGMSRASA